jgi:hypothetical protein
MVVGEIGTPGYDTCRFELLNVTQGMERDLNEYDALFDKSGWRRIQTYEVGGGYSVLELVPIEHEAERRGQRGRRRTSVRPRVAAGVLRGRGDARAEGRGAQRLGSWLGNTHARTA